MVTPTPRPWLSPQVLIVKSFPKELPIAAKTVGPSPTARKRQIQTYK
jgi:hypothetical protein